MRPAFQPPIVNRNPAIVAAPQPPTAAGAVVASVRRSPFALAGVNEPATMPDLNASESTACPCRAEVDERRPDRDVVLDGDVGGVGAQSTRRPPIEVSAPPGVSR